MHSDLTSRRWTVADIRARAEHGLAECRAGLAGAGDKVLDRLFAHRGRDGAIERFFRDGPGRRNGELTKLMNCTLTLLYTTSRSPRGDKMSSASCSAWARGSASPTAGPTLRGDRWGNSPLGLVSRRRH